MEKTNHKKFSGLIWSKKFGLDVIDYSGGFDSQKTWTSLLLSKDEFLERASLCRIKPPKENMSRYEINQMSRRIKNNSDELD